MTTTAIEKKGGGIPLVSWVVSGILVLAGIAGVVVQWTQGMEVTGLNAQIVWGLYIAGFFTAMAGGAGLLTLVGVGEFTGIVPRGERVKMLTLSIASFFAAAVLILVDIGVPLQAWRLITTFRFDTMETLDFWLLIVSGIVALVYLLIARKGAEATTGTKTLGIVGIIAAIALVVVESLMLGQQAAHPMWGGLTMFTFLLSAFIAGLGLALIILPGKTEALKRLTGWLTIGLVASLVVVFSEVVTGLISGNPRLNEEIGSLLSGGAAPFFWFHVAVGLLLPLILLLNASTRTRAVLIGVLALLGVLGDKMWILVAGQEKPWLAVPTEAYFPTWVEFLVLIGVIGLGALAYNVLRLLIQPKEPSA
jgi:molybdopterin-containing oxidoreductase family membrane subunit